MKTIQIKDISKIITDAKNAYNYYNKVFEFFMNNVTKEKTTFSEEFIRMMTPSTNITYINQDDLICKGIVHKNKLIITLTAFKNNKLNVSPIITIENNDDNTIQYDAENDTLTLDAKD